MWTTRKDDEKPQTPAPKPQAPAPTAAPSYQPAPTVETPKMNNARAELAHIGKSVVVKGELSGSEDLFVDGEVEGSIELRNQSLTLGPNSKIRASVFAKEVSVHGKVDGNVTATNKVELKKSAVFNGDISTQRIVVEDGAFFKGSIDIHKGEPAKVQGASASGSSSAGASQSGSPAVAEQAKLL
jgi:cytoskeletal protein CcmA (bactofilin family)